MPIADRWSNPHLVWIHWLIFNAELISEIKKIGVPFEKFDLRGKGNSLLPFAVPGKISNAPKGVTLDRDEHVCNLFSKYMPTRLENSRVPPFS